MSLARVKVWNAGDVLTAADLNAEFDNILNNPGSLISPLTANLNLGNFQITNARLENVTTTQAAAQIGRAMFNTSDNMVNIDDGSVIRKVPTMISSALVAGDLITASTATSPTFKTVALGSSGSYLVVGTSGGPVWAAYFESTPTAFSLSSGFRKAHGFGTTPRMVMGSFVVNTSAVGTYSTGDEIPIVGTMSESNAAGHGALVAMNSSSVILSIGVSVAILSTGGTTAVTSSAFLATLRAWA